MTSALPLSHVYNLARLGPAGDTVSFAATPEELAAIAGWSGVLAVDGLSAKAELRKLSSSRFALDFTLSADVVQSCVVSLEPVAAHIERRFARELHFAGPIRRDTRRDEPKPAESQAIVLPDDDEPPEEIASLQYDLAGPVLEEYILSLEPYPRARGAEFGLKPGPDDRPENPFAALKNLKSGA
jgi:uncharacterized metal-binding protein YceD (DUF177 family)